MRDNESVLTIDFVRGDAVTSMPPDRSDVLRVSSLDGFRLCEVVSRDVSDGEKASRVRQAFRELAAGETDCVIVDCSAVRDGSTKFFAALLELHQSLRGRLIVLGLPHHLREMTREAELEGCLQLAIDRVSALEQAKVAPTWDFSGGGDEPAAFDRGLPASESLAQMVPGHMALRNLIRELEAAG